MAQHDIAQHSTSQHGMAHGTTHGTVRRCISRHITAVHQCATLRHDAMTPHHAMPHHIMPSNPNIFPYKRTATLHCATPCYPCHTAPHTLSRATRRHPRHPTSHRATPRHTAPRRLGSTLRCRSPFKLSSSFSHLCITLRRSSMLPGCRSCSQRLASPTQRKLVAPAIRSRVLCTWSPATLP